MEDNKSKNTIQADKSQGAVQTENVKNIIQHYHGDSSTPISPETQHPTPPAPTVSTALPLQGKMQKNILILSVNPKDTSRLRLDEETREIKEGLKRSKCRDQFIISQAQAVRLRDLSRAMLDCNPAIVHFCGHGEEQGLIIENDDGQATLVNPNALAGLFELLKDDVECVLLNACYSQQQAQAIARHIKYVIGTEKGITDKDAIAFAVGFYDRHYRNLILPTIYCGNSAYLKF